MNLDYAVDRLYESGWAPVFGTSDAYETLADGRRFPALDAIDREFERAGLSLQIKHNLVFDTYRASWAPISELNDSTPAQEARRFGTVIGNSEQEAAVYALALMREAQGLVQVALANA
jgi:hypothetical protein